MGKKKDAEHSVSAVFKAGVVSLAFMIIGYQVALFVHRASVVRILANRDRPDTVYLWREAPARPVASAESPQDTGTVFAPAASSGAVARVARNSDPATREVYRQMAPRRVENFVFDPNTVSVEDLQRLGFSERQAQSIDNYRRKGGRFRRSADFASSYVVADSVFQRLEPYIRIPKIDINRADSAAFETLPGIGPYYAAKMVSYRQELGGYSYPEQLMDIYRFDEEKYRGLADLIECSPASAFRLWELDADSLRLHPYIRNYQTARAIVLFRDHTPRGEWSVQALTSAGILPDSTAVKLARCRIAPAGTE